ncbi:cation diffusion facilitator family transporter [Miltoncostaea marina]|uniref:cation diffusion facilitator family transporter n=1 Tax=Miltoncostaea marina TaxID=2843215 RepID=UPI001C3D4E6C|nr:cation diffusion facilitator family transporter [Miltoncostaea marina]
MGHDHGQAHADARVGSRRALAIALALIATFMLAEIVGGLLTNSLALLADAAHMFSDAASLGLALGAIWLARRPPTPTRTFGYKRAEILAALVNGLTLVAVALWIFFEAYQRFDDPPEILGGWMLVVAVLGLLINVVALRILHGSAEESLNVSAAVRHVLADLLGSVGVIAAAVVILLTGWRPIDPLISVVIGVLVLASSWTILRDSVHILLEGTPRGMDLETLGRRMARVDGVREVHDLHVWTITSGFPALSAHVLVGRQEDCHRRRRELERVLRDEFGIEHTTLQIDHTGGEPIALEPLEQCSSEPSE